jgi:Domain of unknown function (DUF4907)
MKALTIILILTQATVAMSQHLLPVRSKESNNRQSISDSLTCIIIASGNKYGYDIYVGNLLLIHQPSVPGFKGQGGFENKADAEKVASLVIGKLSKGVFPPSVSEEELKNLGIEISNRNGNDRANKQ